MLKTYEEKKSKIQDEILDIGNGVIEALELTLVALKNDDLSKLKDIDLSVKKISNKSNEIDNLIVTTLALYSPEAKDLRELVSYLKITNELVRAGANAKAFAKIFRKSFTEDLNTKTILEYAIPLQKATILALQTSMSMLKESTSNHVEEKYQRVIVEESKTDDLYAMIEKNILKLISKNLELSKEYFEVLSALRKLEKTADRAASIGNLLLFAEKGGDIEQS
ncbi:phosphate signaling complex PhoU family protein [Arcobacter sp. YIC-464]|uniref:phosphate signaling complex PhoU family protein n=1 Tax=Arcobacter sp. YIC-464 TaxID=3376631 RepID=UPI003C155AAB